MTKKKLTISALVSLFFLAAATIAHQWGNIPIFSSEQITIWANSLGYLGPISMISLMWLAVVVSPIPSAPIAMASGALYGHFLGTIFVVIGAELGAVTAFMIARYLAKDAVETLTKGRLRFGLLGSQNTLTITVFVSRVMPFISFDAFSYAAGISDIHLWRFALATFAGIIPTSYLLTHIGSATLTSDLSASIWIVLAMGLITSVSIFLGAGLIKDKLHKP